MKVVLLLVCLAGLAAAQVSTTTNAPPKLKNFGWLVGANRATLREFPFSGLLFGDEAKCSCTLIKPDLVLTAAHCVASQKPGYVYFGSVHQDDGNEVKNTYTEVHLHPDYLSSGRQSGYDIAVVRLDGPYTLSNRINLARLPSGDNSYEGRLAWATAFGTINNDDEASNYLMKAPMTVVKQDMCNFYYAGPGDDKLVCTTSPALLCNGDSGGGLVVRDLLSWRVIGVASVKKVPYGRDPCNRLIPSGYVRVSEHLDFIKSVMQE
uniref:Salivary serine protease n=1 Tax=Simulium guianense TaxID=445764 RepID=F5GTX3_SIMGU